MTVTLTRFGLTYFPVPKVANTSLKQAFFEIEHGHRFEELKHASDQREGQTGPQFTIHRQYETRKFMDLDLSPFRDHLRIAVVRDPAARLLSAWRNRVVHFGELGTGKVSEDKLRNLGLVPDPPLEEFIDNLESYRAIKGSIAVHTAPMVDFLGNDSGYYHFIFRMEKPEMIEALLLAVTGQTVKLRRSQTGGPKVDSMDLDPIRRRKIEEFYAQDYDTFREVLSAPGAVPVRRRSSYNLRGNGHARGNPVSNASNATPQPGPSETTSNGTPMGVRFAALEPALPAGSRCPVCGASEALSGAHYPSKDRQWSGLMIDICGKCGFGYVPEISFDLDAYYRDLYGTAQSRHKLQKPVQFFTEIENAQTRIVRRARTQARLIRELGCKTEMVLDFGPGVGALFHFLKPVRARAVEGDKQAIPYLDHLGIERVEMHAAFSEPYDLIVASHFLEHLPVTALGGFLSDCRNSLRPDGNAVFEVPEWGWVQHRVPPRRCGHEPHTLFFSLESFVRALADAGFRFKHLSTLDKVFPLDSSGFPHLDAAMPKTRVDGTHMLAVVAPSEQDRGRAGTRRPG